VSVPGDTNQAPDDSAAAGGWRARWKRYKPWVGKVLTTAVVIPLVAGAVIWAQHWINAKLHPMHPKQYLSERVTIHDPGAGCEGGQSWVFDKDPPQLPGPPRDNHDTDRWAAANGGVPATGNYISVTLQGLDGRNVLVHDITVNIVSRTEPPHGTWANLVGGCGGFEPYLFSLDLDASPVSVTALPGHSAVPGQDAGRPVDLPHLITGSGPEVWHLAAETKTCTCEWTATLNWSADDGTKGALEINDNGHPFRVAAVTRATGRSTDFHGGWLAPN
jgi:hypothetical protein